jgi:ABC-2 type transport system ATP-binding protein
LGPNGSGKTTTLKLLLGLLHPTKGRTVMLGGDSTNPKISARIGFLPEESYLYRYLTARETLDFYGRLFALPAKVRKIRIETLLDMVGLKAVADRQVGTFSKGMARRIGLAQALINDPDLLILDEPTTGLDPIGTRQIKDLIIELAKRGKTILLCSHLLADVEDVCDRIAILYGGKIQAQGRVKDLLQQTDRRQITMGAVSDVTIERIKEILEGEQSQCEVDSPMERLEAFFIRIVNAAQQQVRPTGGAISTTKIGDFLACKPEEEPQRRILDELVSTPLPPQFQQEPAMTGQVVPVADSKPKPDEQLLCKLAGQAETVHTEPVVKKAPAEAESPQQEQIRKDILDQLAGRPALPDSKQTGNNQGDAGNA